MSFQRTIRPAAFELMQYFYGTIHEPLIHAYLQFDGQIDEQVLLRAVTASIVYVPLLSCVFSPSPLLPGWIDRKFTGTDVVHVESASAEELETRTKTVLTHVLSVENEPPLRLTLLRAEPGDRLCAVVSHLVCDGAGFKQYLYLLSELYNVICSGRACLPVRQTIRHTRLLFQPMGLSKRFSILFSRYDGLTQPPTLRVPMEGDPTNPMILTQSLPSDQFVVLKQFSREHGATINDVVLAAYSRVLAKTTGVSQIALPCPVDLRKYLKKDDSLSICNMTTNYVVNVAIANDSPFIETLLAVSGQIARQKASNACLKSVLLVETAFRLVPFCWMKRFFSRLFTIPVTSYTNLGVLEAERLRFDITQVSSALLTGAIKYAPSFQISVSTFQQTLTLGCNLYGTAHDRSTAEAMLQAVCAEILAAISQ